ncbi:hypothetical protein LWI29_017446 [Acer saccharum]|uniref:Uncharacterized protein n=1 Tax=Acer saccharum TaxID=4024 RepID=A0AA39VPW7_ACESA|nr:hypothetical protein LWI29_017446 [Acer saccharum]
MAGAPNSKISWSYLLLSSSSTTLLVTLNPNAEMPKELSKYSVNPKRTCPLCRCCIIPITKLHIPPPSPPPPPTTTATVSESQQQDHNNNYNQNHQQNISSLEHHQQLDDDGSSNADNFCREQLTIPIEGSSSESNA